VDSIGGEVDARSAALEQLYRERYAVFRDVLTGVTGNYDTAREVVQESFARALRARRSPTAARARSRHGCGGSRFGSR
jgi:DNA-directed RNA polymerase specialized sigma24 family protein